MKHLLDRWERKVLAKKLERNNAPTVTNNLQTSSMTKVEVEYRYQRGFTLCLLYIPQTVKFTNDSHYIDILLTGISKCNSCDNYNKQLGQQP